MPQTTDKICRANMGQDGKTAPTFNEEVQRQMRLLLSSGQFEAYQVRDLLTNLVHENADSELILASLEELESFARVVRQELEKLVKKQPSPDDWVCPECGNDKIQVMDWVEVNTKEPQGDPDAGDYYCPECDTTHRTAVQRKDYE